MVSIYMYHCKVNTDITHLTHLRQCFQMNNISRLKDLWGKYFLLNHLFLLFIYQNNIYQMNTHTHIRSDLLNLGTSKTYKHTVLCCTMAESENL